MNKLLTNYLHFYHYHHCGPSLIWITAVVPGLVVSLSPCLLTASPHTSLHPFTWPPYCSHKTLNQILSLSHSKFSRVFLSHLRKICSLQRPSGPLVMWPSFFFLTSSLLLSSSYTELSAKHTKHILPQGFKPVISSAR